MAKKIRTIEEVKAELKKLDDDYIAKKKKLNDNYKAAKKKLSDELMHLEYSVLKEQNKKLQDALNNRSANTSGFNN